MKNGTRMIQFTSAAGQRKTIRIGKASQRQAEAVKVKIEQLATASITGHGVDDDTARWVASLSDEMGRKLAAVGLVPEREAVTLETFTDRFIEQHPGKPNTVRNYKQAVADLIEFFADKKSIRDIHQGDAVDFDRFLRDDKKLVEGTARQRCKRVKAIFADAIRRRIIRENPFNAVKTANYAEAKFHFVTRADAAKIIEACPDGEWRAIFALVRFGGLRCPSEVLALRWDHIDWARARISVESPKTAAYEGGESRVIPLFDELRPHLMQAFEQASEGAKAVITSYHNPRAQNLRTQFGRIVRRAGLAIWPKPFINCRSTRQTELAETFPMHVVTAWIGNSAAVAKKHYLQVTDEHFERAISQSAAKCAAASARNDSQPMESDSGEREKQAVFGGFPSDAEVCHTREHTRRDSNPQPSVPKTDALSS